VAAHGEVDEGGFLCVAHGDFRCDNVIYEAEAPAVAAILDWELATLGHPLADVAYLCMPYAIPPLPVGPLSGFRGLPLEKLGVPPLEAVVSAYARAIPQGARGDELSKLLAAGLPHFDLFSAVCYFRAASIVRGVYAREKAGTASASNAEAVGALADTMLAASVQLAADHAEVVAGRRAPLAVDFRT